MTSITDFPSSFVLSSMFPFSPKRSKMTDAFSIGLESESRTTVTSMCEVGGGGLYLRPRWAESCADRLIPETAMRAIARERKEAGDNMALLYLLACAGSESCGYSGK